MLTLAAITVYFVGLMTYDHHAGKNQFVVPQATEARDYGTTAPKMKLIPHHASISIDGLASDSDCATLHGTLTGTVCTLNDLSGTTIELPTPRTSTFTTVRLEKLPKPVALCHAATPHDFNLTYTTDSARYAALVPLTAGTLDTCSDGAAWFSRLIYEAKAAPGDPPMLTFKKGHVTTKVEVKTTAVLQISNEPQSASDDAQERDHFFWFYTMLDGLENCTGVPTPSMTTFSCGFTPVHVHSLVGGTGVGCSNTNYP